MHEEWDDDESDDEPEGSCANHGCPNNAMQGSEYCELCAPEAHE